MSGAIVVGGGPAGATVAAILARAEQDVLVLEREPEPVDKVCGDFLSIEAQAVLSELGVDLAPLRASRISFVRMIHRAQVAEAALPFPALGLSRRTLDAALIDRAAGCGADIRRGVKALGLAHQGTELVLRTTAGDVRPLALFLATGKHDLRGSARPPLAPKWVGFKTYLRLSRAQTAALRGAVEMVLFAGGYAGLLLVEGEVANLSLLVRAERLERAGGTFEALVEALGAECRPLADRLSGATQLLPKALAVSGLPYGFLHRPANDNPPAMYRVGDQVAVIPSMTGDGVSIALHSARRAAYEFLAGHSAAEYHAALRSELRGQMHRASLVHRACLVPALQPAAIAACRAAPGIMRLAAAWTRIQRLGAPYPV